MDVSCKINRQKICLLYCVLWRKNDAKILFKESHSEQICFHLQCYLHGLSVCSQLSHAKNLDVLTFAHFIVFLMKRFVSIVALHLVSIFVYFIRSWRVFSKWIIMSILGWEKLVTIEDSNYVESQIKSTVYICASSSYLKYFHIFSYLSNSFWEC